MTSFGAMPMEVAARISAGPAASHVKSMPAAMAAAFGVPYLGDVPLDPVLQRACDAGQSLVDDFQHASSFAPFSAVLGALLTHLAANDALAKSAAPTLRGNEKQAAKALERAVDLATHPPPSDELIQACADAFSRSPPSVAEAGVRHLRKKLQAADKNYDVALLSCGVAGRVVAASPAAQKAVGSGDGGKKFMAVMLKQACDRRPSQLQKGARQLIETWQATYASNPGLPYFATVAVELAAFKHQNGEAPSAAPTDALQFAGGSRMISCSSLLIRMVEGLPLGVYV